MEIYLVRHTTPKIEKGICYGQLNLDVAESFSSEVVTIKKQLPLKSNCKIYSSPLLRCTKLAEQLGNPIYLDSRLKEVNFGTWENVAWNAIPKNEIDPWMADFVNQKPPKGESYIELQNRVLDFFIQLKARNNDDSPIIIVAHAGPIRAFLAHTQNIELKDSFDIKLEYGQVVKLEY